MAKVVDKITATTVVCDSCGGIKGFKYCCFCWGVLAVKPVSDKTEIAGVKGG